MRIIQLFHRKAEMKKTILEALDDLSGMSAEELRNHRYDKFRKMGEFLS